MHILIVSEVPEFCSLTERALFKYGHNSKVALSGEAALELIDKSSPFDAALVDYVLPGMDGIDLIREIRARKNLMGVVMTTAEGRTTVDKKLEAELDVWTTLYRTAKPGTVEEKLREAREFMQIPDETRKKLLLGLGYEASEIRKLLKKNRPVVE